MQQQSLTFSSTSSGLGLDSDVSEHWADDLWQERVELLEELLEEWWAATADVVVLVNAPIAATCIQRHFRGYQCRRCYRRHRAHGLIARVARGFQVRARLAEEVAAGYSNHLTHAELQQFQPLEHSAGPTHAATSGRGSAPKEVAPARRIRSAFDAVYVLQRWMRRYLPMLRERLKSQLVRRVVQSAVTIQRVWRGAKARQAHEHRLRRLRWRRQLDLLQSELDRCAVSDESVALSTLLLGADATASETLASTTRDDGASPPISGEDELIDVEQDAAYFHAFVSVPGDVTFSQRRRESERTFATRSLATINKALDRALAAAEQQERNDTDRRIVHTLHQLRRRRRATASSAIPTTSANAHGGRRGTVAFRLSGSRLRDQIARLHYSQPPTYTMM